MKHLFFSCIVSTGLLPGFVTGQIKWENADSLFQPLPASIHVYYTNDSLGNKPNIAYYVKIPLKDQEIIFDTDTALNRGLTPSAYYEKNNEPVVVVNCTFFSPERRNVNVVFDNGRMVSYNVPSVYSKTDTLYHYITRSAIGINRRRIADVAWIYTDTARGKAYEIKNGPVVCSGSNKNPGRKEFIRICKLKNGRLMRPWRMITAAGGGPSLISNGVIRITNEEERMFTGKAINDRHPRTAMGYTTSGDFIIMAIQGRFPGIAEGATLGQEAQILKELGCIEALNLDGGGSSCLLINGKETISPSDKTGQRPVPAVFMVKRRK